MSSIPQAGDRVGGYTIRALVAQGGQGVVYEAQREADGARVALKLLLDVEPEARERFEREALELARVEHPHVVRVHELGLHEHKPFMAMEWIEGQSLFERVRRGGVLDPPEAVAVLGEVAGALAACHRAGLVHRDVKPQNVVLQAERGAVLVDFGLVHVSGEGGQLAKRLTVTGEILGTPAYMAPEQAEASFGAVSPASDVYALGATLYYVLTGDPPLSTRGGLTAVLLRLVEEPPPDPRARRPDLPPALAELCLACLAKRPEERPPDAAAFAARLSEASSAPRPASWVGPALAAGVAALGLGGLLAVWSAGSPADTAAQAAGSGSAPGAAPAPRVTPSPSADASPAPGATAGEASLSEVVRTADSSEAVAWSRLARRLASAEPGDPGYERLLGDAEVILRKLPTKREEHYEVLRKLQAAREDDRPGRLLRWTVAAGSLAWAEARRAAGRDEERERGWLERATQGLLLGARRFELQEPKTPEQRRVVFLLGSAVARRGILRYASDFTQAEGETRQGMDLLGLVRAEGNHEGLRNLAEVAEARFELARKVAKGQERLNGRLLQALQLRRDLVALPQRTTRDRRLLAQLLDRGSMHLAEQRRFGRACALASEAAEAYAAWLTELPTNAPYRQAVDLYRRIALSRSYRWGRKPQPALGLLTPCFSDVQISSRLRGSNLAREYFAVWRRWCWLQPRTALPRLRAVLKERPWASSALEDRSWIQELERKLQGLLDDR